MYTSLLLKPLLKNVHANSVLWVLASPATLSVDQSHSAPAVLDFILVSALLMEKKREDEERVRQHPYNYIQCTSIYRALGIHSVVDVQPPAEEDLDSGSRVAELQMT